MRSKLPHEIDTDFCDEIEGDLHFIEVISKESNKIIRDQKEKTLEEITEEQQAQHKELAQLLQRWPLIYLPHLRRLWKVMYNSYLRMRLSSFLRIILILKRKK